MTPAATKNIWNAADYAANSVVQQTWARELIARLKLRGGEHVLDVGCGDGKITAEIARAVPRGFVAGIDASAEMIGFARQSFPPSQIPNLQFQICDARKINMPNSSRVSRRSAGLRPGANQGGGVFNAPGRRPALRSTSFSPTPRCIGWTTIRRFCAAWRQS